MTAILAERTWHSGDACLVTRSRKEILVSAADIWRLGGYCWSVSQGRVQGKPLARHVLSRTYLHRVLTCAMAGQSVDHVNGNSLDNRRSNLRICTHAENMRNRKLHKNNGAGFKGVSKRARGGFMASIKAAGSRYYLGTFPTAEEAHAAYCAASTKLHGQFARHR